MRGLNLWKRNLGAVPESVFDEDVERLNDDAVLDKLEAQGCLVYR